MRCSDARSSRDRPGDAPPCRLRRRIAGSIAAGERAHADHVQRHMRLGRRSIARATSPLHDSPSDSITNSFALGDGP